MSGYRPMYTSNEDAMILKIIIDTKSYYRIRGKALWEDMANTGLIDRTWQSMKERFEKHILPRINQYDIPAIEKKNFELAKYQLKLYAKGKASAMPRKECDSESSEDDD